MKIFLWCILFSSILLSPAAEAQIWNQSADVRLRDNANGQEDRTTDLYFKK